MTPLSTLLILFACPLITYAWTYWQFWRVVKSPDKGKYPPTLPYALPGLGHALPFSWDTAKFTSSLKQGFENIPIRLRLVVMDIVLITKASDINRLFGQSQHTNSKVYREFVSNTFGVPQDFKDFFAADMTGMSKEPRPGTHIKEEHRVDYLMHTFLVRFLSGPSLNPLAHRFAENLAARLKKVDITKEWTELPDLYKFVQDHVFHASVKSMFGSEIFKVNPDLCEIFWEFDSNVPELARGYPQILNRSAYNARDKCISAMHRWHKFLDESPNSNEDATEEDYNHTSGARIIRERHSAFAKMEPMSAQAKATEDLALLWAANSNATHGAFWTTFEIFRSPNVLRAFQEATRDAQENSHQSPSPSFDVSKLCASPFLQSLYAETLRLYVANIVLRTPVDQDLAMREWLLPRGGVVAAMSYVAHRDEKHFPTGTDKEPHPLSEFWAERFLREEGTEDDVSMQEKTGHGQFSLDGLAGAWIPYGGGTNMCPGRHFAKQEILLAAALFVSMFEVQSEGPLPEPDHRFFGSGTLGVKGKARCKIRRRAE